MMTQQQTTASRAEPLGLESVLVSSLPTTLLTDNAPGRYPVDAVFTRRPETDEISQITSDDTRDFFRQQGYPAMALSIADRRLRIANTNLEELRDGLAALVGQRLAWISDDTQSRRDSAAEQHRHSADQEHQRAAAVALAASSVSFAARDQVLAASSAWADRAAGERSSARWDDDGGHSTTKPQNS